MSSGSIARCAMIQFGDTVRTDVSVESELYSASVTLSPTALLREVVGQPPSMILGVDHARGTSEKKRCITRDHVPHWWNWVQVLLMVVVRGSPRIHVRANERGRERERVAERRMMTSARSYAPPVLIPMLGLGLGLGLGLRVTREGTTVGRGRASEWALSLSLLSLLIVGLLSLWPLPPPPPPPVGLGLGLALVLALLLMLMLMLMLIVVVRGWRARRLGAC